MKLLCVEVVVCVVALLALASVVVADDPTEKLPGVHDLSE